MREMLELWPVALVTVAAPAVAVGLYVASSSFTLASQPEGYPVRFELPPVGAGQTIEFDLADSGAAGPAGSELEIRKAVRFNGAEAGSATIRVSAGSRLSIAARELSGLMARAGNAPLAERIGGRGGAGRFVDFEELRRLGIDVRYDASADRIAITG